MLEIPSASTSARRMAKCGRAETKDGGGSASRGTYRTCSRSRLPSCEAVIVAIPTPLRSYTLGAATVEASGATVSELLRDLDAQYPGIRFRMIDEQDSV